MITSLYKRLHLWDPPPKRLQSLRRRHTYYALDSLKTKLVVNGNQNILAHLSNRAVLMTQGFTKLAKNRIKGIVPVNSSKLLLVEDGLQLTSGLMELTKPSLQMIVRFEGLNIEVTLFLDQEGQDSLTFFVLITR